MGGKEGRGYEGMFIMVPTLNEEGFEKTVKAITDAIKKQGGEVEESQKWGKRRLAFRIRKQQDGLYHLVKFRCSPSAISELKSTYKLNEVIMRVLIISVNSKAAGGAVDG